MKTGIDLAARLTAAELDLARAGHRLARAELKSIEAEVKVVKAETDFLVHRVAQVSGPSTGATCREMVLGFLVKNKEPVRPREIFSLFPKDRRPAVRECLHELKQAKVVKVDSEGRYSLADH